MSFVLFCIINPLVNIQIFYMEHAGVNKRRHLSRIQGKASCK